MYNACNKKVLKQKLGIFTTFILLGTLRLFDDYTYCRDESKHQFLALTPPTQKLKNC